MTSSSTSTLVESLYDQVPPRAKSPCPDGYAGGLGGQPWSDLALIDDEHRREISAIHIWYHEGIHELRVQYRTDESPRWANAHGSSAGPWDMKKCLFTLESGEYITEVGGRSGAMIDALQFTTNTGRKSTWCGKRRRGAPFSFTGSRLIYLTGRAGDQLDGIQPHWESHPEQ